MGDFNATLHSHEKQGPGKFSLGSAAEFGAMVDACSMSQVPSIGRKFTWTNNRCRGNVCSVLDRSFFRGLKIAQLDFTDSGWITTTLIEWWQILGRNGFWELPIYVLVNKLKKLKGVIRDWARSAFPHLDWALEEAKRGLAQIQEQIDTEGMDDQLYALEAVAKTTLIKVMENHEKMWAAKARIRWLKFGDRYSKCFQLSTKMRRNKITIRSLKKQDGSMVDDPIQIGNYIVDFYENFHKATPTVQHEELLDNIPLILNQIDHYHMDALPGDAEIKRVVWELDPDSSPGPDGFPGAFFRRCWHIVEKKVSNAVRYFFSSSSMPQGVNNNFLVLIPKVDGADNLGNFRPLCMGNFFCKIITKVMALWLEPLLPRLISDEQGAFRKGKIIHDNIIVASKLVNLMFSSTRGGATSIKIDIKKAYDTIDWKFTFQVMHRFGFSERWIGWLNQILISTKISILVNGGPQGFFNVERGLRQGQCINLDKSKLFLGKIASARKQSISNILGIWSCSFPTKYLGVEIFNGRLKKKLWTDLAAVYFPTNPWMMVGDFNALLASHEKQGTGAFNLGSTAEFSAMVDVCHLIQLPSLGVKFTWTNNRKRGNVSDVLDRGFCNEAWLS
ncbi:uncharacterized protein LOC122092960 [Macadamia integrifolia]|uniref:uncharacterized protein LOC122092960 n=1 Tax=Macadamia integrifolia TaxID=60698 RepID=UPI001C52D51E|nr:uncharacterized protein LOC122092960 [Macadamia integrifolia]